MPRFSPRAGGSPSIGRVVAYGHSALQDNGVSDIRRGVVERVAMMLDAKPVNWAKGGASIMFENDITNSEFGVLPFLLQSWRRRLRAAGTLTAGVSAGATQIGVTVTGGDLRASSNTGVAFKAEDLLMVGDGTDGEIIRALNLTATTIDVGGSETKETYALLRAHNAGDPVYVVPGHYEADDALVLFCESGNHFARYGPGVYTGAAPAKNSQRWYQEALRMCLSRLRAAETYMPAHTALVFTGSWGATVGGTGVSQGGGKNPTAINAAVTLHVPDNFPGGAVSFNCGEVGGNPGGGVWTFTVDGQAEGSFTQIATPTTPRNKFAYHCHRITGLTAGRHVITATMTTYEANTYFDCWVLEAEDPPPIVVFKAHRLLSYDGTTSSFEHGHIRPTLAAQANPGDTSISVNQSPVSVSRQLAAGSIPKAGEYLVIDPQPGDVAPQEVRVVTSVTGTGPFTINFSGGQLTQTHTAGTRVELGLKDYDLRNVINPWIESVVAEFDDQVILHDFDTYIQKDPQWFHLDGMHLNDEGQALAAERVHLQLTQGNLFHTRSHLTRLRQPTTCISFLSTAASGIAWNNMPAALSEFPLTTTGNGNYRRVADLTRFTEARLCAVQGVVGATNAKMRVQYSVDNGATWHYLHRVRSSSDPQYTSTNWAESTAATDPMCQIAMNPLPSTGVQFTDFEPIYPEVQQAQYTATLLRIVGIGGDGVADPSFASIWLELR